MRAAELRIDDLLEMDRAGGIIRFGGHRTLLFDAIALGLLRKELVDTVGPTATRGLLTRLGYAHGWRTAEAMREAVAWDDPREWRIAGGRLHRLQGMVRFEPVIDRQPDTVAEAIWHDAYEAEQHVVHLGRADEPVCWSLCGFASGYLSRVTGETVFAVEESCCGRGDSVCRMVARTEAQWARHDADALAAHRRYYDADCLDDTLERLRASLITVDRTLRARQRALGDGDGVIDTAGLVARSEQMQRVLELARRVAAVDSTLLIRGESGVGKERVARFVHDASPRAGGPFIAINCGALPEQLLESELFGHSRGAFTGATTDRAGLFEAAHTGTLLLDEIGDVPPALQIRLLRVLQERTVRRIGENRDRPFDVRVLAATHRDLEAEIAAGRFRADLYYRLRVVEVKIPPLRDRRDDILPLARLALAEVGARYQRQSVRLGPSAARALLTHDWPGNVRELRNAVEQAVVLAAGETLEAADLPLGSRPEPPKRPEPGASPMAHTEATDALDSDAVGEASRTLAEVERSHILATLAQASGNRAETARRLGIGEATLYRKLKRYGVKGTRG